MLYQRPAPDGAGLAPVRDLDVNSLVTEVRDTGPTLAVTGWAWGSAPVVDVEVGVDDGERGTTARRPVLDPPASAARSPGAGSAPSCRARPAPARSGPAPGTRRARRQPASGARNARHVVELAAEPDVAPGAKPRAD